MLQNHMKSEIVSSGDEAQIHYVEHASHLKYMPLSKDNFEVANAYNLRLRKKKRIRTAFTTDQVLILENTFSERKYIDKWTRKKLASHLSISEKNVKIWFQNRRMKNKRLSSESDCSEANDREKKNESNEINVTWSAPCDSTSDNSYNQSNNGDVKSNGNDVKNYNGIEDYKGPVQNESFYAESYQQCAYEAFVPVHNGYPNYYEYNNYYYNHVEYDPSMYNYNWPQYYTH